jgi:putative hydrolase of HD superfamily
MDTPPDIHRLIDFTKLALSFRAVERRTFIPGTDTHENDVDHSYHLAMMAWFLAPYFPHLNRDKVIRLGLVHDLVEVHAGDTFPYGDPALVASKKEREAAALVQLKKDWPDFTEFTDELEQYEERDSEEAKFVYALDKILPALINYLDGGRVWREHGITLDDARHEKATKVAVSPIVNNYYEQLIEIFKDNDHLFPSRPAPKQKP